MTINTPNTDNQADTVIDLSAAETTVFGERVDISDSQRPTLPTQRGASRTGRPKVNVAVGREAMRSSSSKWLYDRRHYLIAALLAAPIMWRPGDWGVAALIVILVTQTRSQARGAFTGEWLSTASFVVLPVRVAVGLVRALPASIFLMIGLILQSVVGAALGTALFSGIGSLIGLAHGDGHWLILADLRGWAWNWGLPLGLASGSSLFITQRLRKHGTPLSSATLEASRRWLPTVIDSLGELRLVIITVSAVALGVVTLAAGPGGGVPTLGVAGPVKQPITKQLNTWLQKLDVSEANASLQCPSTRLYGSVVALTHPRWILIRVPESAHATRAELLTELGVLQNRLDPWTDAVTIAARERDGSRIAYTLNRDKYGRTSVLRDFSSLRPDVTPAPSMTELRALSHDALTTC